MRALTRVLVLSLSFFSFACTAKDSDAGYKLGTHYKRVATVSKPDDETRVRVEEFFWYGCGHCYNFEPQITAWKARKPSDVDFVQVPNSLGRPVGELHQKAFYTAKALDVFDKIHKPLFEALHEKRQNLSTEAALANFFQQQAGIKPDLFSGTLNGFAVDSQARRAAALARDYRIFSVPSVVVGGKYWSSAELAGGSFADLTKVIDHLIETIREERK